MGGSQGRMNQHPNKPSCLLLPRSPWSAFYFVFFVCFQFFLKFPYWSRRRRGRVINSFSTIIEISTPLIYKSSLILFMIHDDMESIFIHAYLFINPSLPFSGLCKDSENLTVFMKYNI